jgi:hypothetical protein
MYRLLKSSVADPGCVSRIRLFSIQDPNCFRPGYASKNLSTLPKKWFLSSRKYDPGCSSRISDPGVKKAPDPMKPHHFWEAGFGSTLE